MHTEFDDLGTPPMGLLRVLAADCSELLWPLLGLEDLGPVLQGRARGILGDGTPSLRAADGPWRTYLRAAPAAEIAALKTLHWIELIRAERPDFIIWGDVVQAWAKRPGSVSTPVLSPDGLTKLAGIVARYLRPDVRQAIRMCVKSRASEWNLHLVCLGEYGYIDEDGVDDDLFDFQAALETIRVRAAARAELSEADCAALEEWIAEEGQHIGGDGSPVPPWD